MATMPVLNTLPVRSPKPNTTAAPSKGNVLVVDDSKVVRTIVGEYLRKGGYTVTEAESGRSAQRLLQASPFDVVVTDLKMADGDGFELLESVKSRSMLAEVIILTGTHAKDIDCAIRALRLGAHDFLTKPPQSAEQMLLAVERALDKKRLQEANLRLLRELEAQTRTDALTGAFNRRAFDVDLERELALSARYGVPLAMLLLDLDHFKEVNDSLGHLAGDEILKRVVGIVQDGLRNTDILYRYGGEEFAVLLPHTGLAAAHECARRLVKKVAGTAITVEDDSVCVTVSIGVASTEEGLLKKKDLAAAADAAVYVAKREGRNRARTQHIAA